MIIQDGAREEWRKDRRKRGGRRNRPGIRNVQHISASFKVSKKKTTHMLYFSASKVSHANRYIRGWAVYSEDSAGCVRIIHLCPFSGKPNHSQSINCHIHLFVAFFPKEAPKLLLMDILDILTAACNQYIRHYDAPTIHVTRFDFYYFS